MTNPEQARSEEMQAKALRLAMDYAIIALNGMNFDTSLASVKTEDIPRIAADICDNGRGRLAALLTAEAERSELKGEVAAIQAGINHEWKDDDGNVPSGDTVADYAVIMEHHSQVEKQRDQLRAELAQLRRNVAALYEWIQGNTSLTGKQKEAANRIFDQLDKGVKDGK